MCTHALSLPWASQHSSGLPTPCPALPWQTAAVCTSRDRHPRIASCCDHCCCCCYCCHTTDRAAYSIPPFACLPAICPPRTHCLLQKVALYIHLHTDIQLLGPARPSSSIRKRRDPTVRARFKEIPPRPACPPGRDPPETSCSWLTCTVSRSRVAFLLSATYHRSETLARARRGDTHAPTQHHPRRLTLTTHHHHCDTGCACPSFDTHRPPWTRSLHTDTPSRRHCTLACLLLLRRVDAGSLEN